MARTGEGQDCVSRRRRWGLKWGVTFTEAAQHTHQKSVCPFQTEDTRLLGALFCLTLWRQAQSMYLLFVD